MPALNECKEFLAGDDTLLRELLHPARIPVRIGYSLAHGRLEPGCRSKRHRLASTEVYYFLAGQGVFRVGEQSCVARPGTVVCVPERAEQWVENTGHDVMEFLCFVDPAWKAEDEEILE
ncbi:MAG: cupin domain-containing protein [Nitrospiraceae bacterium]